MLIRFVKQTSSFAFMKRRIPALLLSLVLILASIALVCTKGLNLGIDFRGGLLLEAKSSEIIDMQGVRAKLATLNLGDVTVQNFGSAADILIRVKLEDVKQQNAVVTRIKQALPAEFEYRRVEFVGPSVGSNLAQKAAVAVIIALLSIVCYVWARFEWQYGVGALAALVHDVITTVGFFALFGLDFDLSTVAAILTIAGYSMNDTIVVFDRVRDNLRKYKKMPLLGILDQSLNETLSRTIITASTTLIAVLCLYFFGAKTTAAFSLAMIWGIVIGTYSSLYIAAPILQYCGLKARPQQTVISPIV
jgi:preprotein translocase subunit SecF